LQEKPFALANITGAELRDIHVTGYEGTFLARTMFRASAWMRQSEEDVRVLRKWPQKQFHHSGFIGLRPAGAVFAGVDEFGGVAVVFGAHSRAIPFQLFCRREARQRRRGQFR